MPDQLKLLREHRDEWRRIAKHQQVRAERAEAGLEQAREALDYIAVVNDSVELNPAAMNRTIRIMRDKAKSTLHQLDRGAGDD